MFKCEYEGCDQEATVEYKWYDEDGDGYYTLGCDEHPADLDYYEAVQLYCTNGHDISDPATTNVDCLKGRC